jgi:hypothetical protein
VYGWNEQSYFTDPTVGKFEQVIPDFLMVKICVFLANFSLLDFDPGMGLNVVIVAGVAFFQDLVNRFAAIATKRFFVEYHGIVSAMLPAMVTAYFILNVQLSNCPTVQLSN